MVERVHISCPCVHDTQSSLLIASLILHSIFYKSDCVCKLFVITINTARNGQFDKQANNSYLVIVLNAHSLIDLFVLFCIVYSCMRLNLSKPSVWYAYSLVLYTWTIPPECWETRYHSLLSACEHKVHVNGSL